LTDHPTQRRAFAYCRVSRPEAETASQSLRMQEERIRLYAPFAGLQLVEVFVDDGVSGGKPLGQRPAGARLLQALQPGDAVVSLRLDRMFRDTLDALDTVKHLDANDIATHFVDFGGQPFDSTSAVGRLFFIMQVAFAEFERYRIAERIRENKTSRRNHGRTYAVPQFGRDNVDGRVEENAEEQDVLDRIRDLRSQGLSYRRIASTLQREGVPRKQGGEYWYASTVHKILQRTA
jgi:DNA invertase Pin-like site-specific DNA recombinase